MGIHSTPTPQHWNYFLALEDDVARISRYLEFADANYDCYSLELARILFAAASEADVVCKQICLVLNSESNAKSFKNYRQEIGKVYPQMVSTVVDMPRFGLAFSPWSGWTGKKVPLWWQAYNNVKHMRHTHFSDASLRHTLNAVAGLFVALLFFYRDEGQEGQLSPNPRLFHAGTPFSIGRSAFGSDTNLYTLLPSSKG